MKRLTLFALSALLFSSCSTVYKLKPTAEKPEYIDGVALQETITQDCVVAAGYVSNDTEEMKVMIRVTNKTDESFDIHPASFSLSANTKVIPNGTIQALEPDTFLAQLTSDAETLETRARTNNWDGVGILTDTGVGQVDDAELKRLRREHERNQRENAENIAEATRKREKRAALEGKLLKRNTVKPGATTTGMILFPSQFKDEGKIDFNVKHPNCTLTIVFDLTN